MDAAAEEDTLPDSDMRLCPGRTAVRVEVARKKIETSAVL